MHLVTVYFSYSSNRHSLVAKATAASIYHILVWYNCRRMWFNLKFLRTGNAILSSNLGISLKGLAIGNGWIDGRHQYPAYLDYAVKHGIIEENSDVRLFSMVHDKVSEIVLQLWKSVKQETDDCVAALDQITNSVPVQISKCEGLVSSIAMSHGTTYVNFLDWKVFRGL